ncbi:hypothetical protein HDU98_010167 [Podochytrium sp. JEL0797]|nr:hypothetical protein HDU98_010167 [Podochytrium sp. JEL0797]
MEDGVEDNTQFASQEYWESRYASESTLDPTHPISTFEWVKGWSFYGPTLSPLIPTPTTPILHLGCGNSRFAVDMLEQSGFTHHTNVDYSASVVETMRRAFVPYKDTIKWVVADIFELNKTIEENAFEVVVDKGTLDAFLTAFPDDDPWDPSEEQWELVRKYMAQVHRVVKPGGIFVHITWAQPHFRKKFCEVTGMQVEVKRVGTDWEYFVYVCRKAVE